MCSFKCINIVRVGCNGRPYRCVLSSVSTLYEWDVMAVLTDVLFQVQQHCTSGCNGCPYRCVLSSATTLYEWDVMAVLTDVFFQVYQHCTSGM